MSSINKIPTQHLGKEGPEVPRMGIGLMSLSGIYGKPGPDEERLAFLDAIYARGETFWELEAHVSVVSEIITENLTAPRMNMATMKILLANGSQQIQRSVSVTSPPPSSDNDTKG